MDQKKRDSIGENSWDDAYLEKTVVIISHSKDPGQSLPDSQRSPEAHSEN